MSTAHSIALRSSRTLPGARIVQQAGIRRIVEHGIHHAVPFAQDVQPVLDQPFQVVLCVRAGGIAMLVTARR